MFIYCSSKCNVTKLIALQMALCTLIFLRVLLNIDKAYINVYVTSHF
jgi:hypothetical protein